MPTQGKDKQIFISRLENMEPYSLCRVSSLRIIIIASHQERWMDTKKKRRMDAGKNEDLKDDEEQA